MDYTAYGSVDEEDLSLDRRGQIGRSTKWKKRRRPHSKKRRPSRPLTYIGQRSNKRLRRL